MSDSQNQTLLHAICIFTNNLFSFQLLQLETDTTTKAVHKYNVLVTKNTFSCGHDAHVLCDTVNVLKLATCPRDGMGNMVVFNLSIKLLHEPKQH